VVSLALDPQVALQPEFTVVSEPENVKHVLQNIDLYGKGPVWSRK
jgi:hypothetical protein